MNVTPEFPPPPRGTSKLLSVLLRIYNGIRGVILTVGGVFIVWVVMTSDTSRWAMVGGGGALLAGVALLWSAIRPGRPSLPKG